MDIQFYTGTDQRLFLQTLPLLQSFAERVPQGRLTVVDFGLAPAQRRLFQELGLYGAKPTLPNRFDHPWHYKAAAADNLPAADAVVWLDADMILLEDIAARLRPLIARMTAQDRVLAATNNANEQRLAQFLQDNAAETQPFREALAYNGITLDHPYLNSGFIVVRSPAWLREWRAMTLDMPSHLLFEQNAFNLIAWCEPERVQLLDHREWNAHGRDLARIVAGPSGDFHLDGRRVAVIHATSDNPADTDWRNVTWPAGRQRIDGHLRLFQAPLPREQQIMMFDHFLEDHKDLLAACFDP